MIDAVCGGSNAFEFFDLKNFNSFWLESNLYNTNNHDYFNSWMIVFNKFLIFDIEINDIVNIKNCFNIYIKGVCNK